MIQNNKKSYTVKILRIIYASGKRIHGAGWPQNVYTASLAEYASF